MQAILWIVGGLLIPVGLVMALVADTYSHTDRKHYNNTELVIGNVLKVAILGTAALMLWYGLTGQFKKTMIATAILAIVTLLAWLHGFTARCNDCGPP